MISERTLRRWRKDSLKREPRTEQESPDVLVFFQHEDELHRRILLLTQELMDLALIMKGR